MSETTKGESEMPEFEPADEVDTSGDYTIVIGGVIIAEVTKTDLTEEAS